MNGRRPWFAISVLILGYLFLYSPIVSLMVYSFNESRLVTVWAGFSTKWYGALMQNDALLSGAWLSVQIAFLTASLSVVLGTLAAFALIRFGNFRGRTLFAGMVTAPLVMPEVITGLSLLLLFVAMEGVIGWPQRGMMTIVIAHATFATAYVTVVVQSRLGQLDMSLEEAAMDLGAKPFKVVRVITLPLIWPAMLAGWLLAFTLSFDDLVVATFTSGPGAKTLPMEVFSSVRMGVSPQINALATIFIVIVTAMVVIANQLAFRKRQS